MADAIVERICAGEYEVRKNDFRPHRYKVRIARMEHLDYQYGQWVVSAHWDPCLVSDPIIYLKDAKALARQMIAEALAEGRV